MRPCTTFSHGQPYRCHQVPISAVRGIDPSSIPQSDPIFGQRSEDALHARAGDGLGKTLGKLTGSTPGHDDPKGHSSVRPARPASSARTACSSRT